MPNPAVEIPYEQLNPETLRSVIEEFVTRDGTELSESEDKIEQVRKLLDRGDVQLWYDEATCSCNILKR